MLIQTWYDSLSIKNTVKVDRGEDGVGYITRKKAEEAVKRGVARWLENGMLWFIPDLSMRPPIVRRASGKALGVRITTAAVAWPARLDTVEDLVAMERFDPTFLWPVLPNYGRSRTGKDARVCLVKS